MGAAQPRVRRFVVPGNKKPASWQVTVTFPPAVVDPAGVINLFGGFRGLHPVLRKSYLCPEMGSTKAGDARRGLV